MYGSLIFTALYIIAVSEGCQPPPCHWTDAKPIEDYYHQVVNVMLAADRNIQNYCRQKGAPTITEDHKPKQYKLIYPSDTDSYEIKVRNRALMVRAESCSGSVADVRVLPAYVEPRGAHYTVEQGQLIITFPYKYDPVLGGGVCIPPDPTILTIPRGTPECTDCNKRGW